MLKRLSKMFFFYLCKPYKIINYFYFIIAKHRIDTQLEEFELNTNCRICFDETDLLEQYSLHTDMSVEELKNHYDGVFYSDEYQAAFKQFNLNLKPEVAGLSTKPILINLNCCNSIDRVIFIILHEVGHHILGTSEIAANAFAKKMIGFMNDN